MLNLGLANTEIPESVPEKKDLGKFIKGFMYKNNKKPHGQYYFKD